MKPEKVKFKAEHAQQLLDARAKVASLGWYSGGNGIAWAQMAEQAGPAWSLLEGQEVIACAGIALGAGPTGTAWSMLGSLFCRRVKTCWRAIKEGLEETQRLQGLMRVTTYVNAADPTALRFAERLGFELEGYHEAWGPNGENFFSLGRVRKNE